MSDRRSGAAMLVVLATLALVAFTALAFARMAMLEADASTAHGLGVRARFAASAGVEFAAARLLGDLRAGDVSAPHAPWRHPGGPLDRQAIVSYPDPAVDGGTCSGAVGPDERFALRILDANSQLDLNLPGPSLGETLDDLGRAIEILWGEDPVRGRGDEVVALRDARGRFETKDDLAAIFGPRDLQLLESYVTVHARVDPHALSPAAEHHHGALPGVVSTPRAPVALNTAPFPVLVAVLSGVEGPRGGPVPFHVACQVAGGIVHRRSGEGPFTTQQEFREFLGALAVPPREILTEDWVLAISINADPNLRSSRTNPDRVVYAPFDRSDLRRFTTEFCFIESGIFEVVSEGRVVGSGGVVLARAQARAVVRLFEILSHSLQSEFDATRLTGPEANSTTAPNPAVEGVPASHLAGHVQLLAPPAPESVARSLDEGADRRGVGDDDEPVQPGGSGLLSDGRLFAPWIGRLAVYALPPELAKEGALEFWVKLDERPEAGPIPIALLSQPLTAEAGIQHRIQIACDGRTMIVESTRLVYVAEDAGREAERASFPIPFAYEESSWISILETEGDFHSWHHVSVGWSDGTSQVLQVDGRRGRVVSETMARPDLAFAGWPPYREHVLLAGGCDARSTGVVVHPATIDGLWVGSGDPGRGGLQGVPPTRYEDLSNEEVGYYRGEFDFPGDDAVEILGFWRDEWIPAARHVPSPGRIELGLAVGPPWRGGRPDSLPKKAQAKTLKKHGVWIVQESEVLAYEIRFVRDPSAHPLNVTPIVEELAVSFSRSRIDWLEYVDAIGGS